MSPALETPARSRDEAALAIAIEALHRIAAGRAPHAHLRDTAKQAINKIITLIPVYRPTVKP
jgi:hypothetical protein